MRYPAVAGQFYPGTKTDLKLEVSHFFERAKVKKRNVLAAVCPHAGYIYSGFTAAHSFASMANVAKPNLTVVFIGPNHTGAGALAAVSRDDWLTPLGAAKCDTALAAAIKKESRLADFDEMAHMHEHSIEVQIPFLQHLNPDAKIVCIAMMEQGLEASLDIGKAIHAAVKSEAAKGREIIVVASSDFTHYESAESARKKDTEALELIKQLKYSEFQTLVEAKQLSICGHGPIAVALCYSKLKGAKSAEVLKYTNSGEASGDYLQVVGYASIVVNK